MTSLQFNRWKLVFTHMSRVGSRAKRWMNEEEWIENTQENAQGPELARDHRKRGLQNARGTLLQIFSCGQEKIFVRPRLLSIISSLRSNSNIYLVKKI